MTTSRSMTSRSVCPKRLTWDVKKLTCIQHHLFENENQHREHEFWRLHKIKQDLIREYDKFCYKH